MHINWIRVGTPLFAATTVFSKDLANRDVDWQDGSKVHVKLASSNQIARADDAIHRFMIQNSIPGLSIGVSINGKIIWKSGFGYSDVEQGTRCNGDTSMRIASISKPITACVAAKLVQEGKLLLDKPIQEYIKNFPVKNVDGEIVQITTRQLLCHTGGIRHYAKPKEKPQSSSNIPKEAGKKSDEKKAAANSSESDDSKKETTESDTVFEEFYSRKHYKSVTEALEMFKDDPLESKPGFKFLYTTHGFTLISAVLEKAADQDFPGLLKDLFRKIGMNHTYLDFNQPIMPHRTKYYYRDSKHRLHNCPEVNNSYKWGGGGLVSCVTDLLKFAHVILYSYQADNSSLHKPLIEKKVMDEFWKFHTVYKLPTKYCLGWMNVEEEEFLGGVDSNRTGFWYHTGAAVGAASVLLIRPDRKHNNPDSAPNGVCVAILINIQDCAAEITQLALELSEIFSE